MTAKQNPSKKLTCDVCVIGTGMAGSAAALFAARRGLRTAQIGCTGEIIFATGLFDLMGVHPLAEQRGWSDPWAAIEALIADLPHHPYARLTRLQIETAVGELLAFLDAAGLPYRLRPDENVQMPTPMGTVKITHAVPATMWPAVEGLEKRSACLLVDIAGLKGYSARQIAGALSDRWPGIKTARLVYDEVMAGGEVFAERLARSLEQGSGREKFAAGLKPLVTGWDLVGLPAVLGVNDPNAVRQELENRLGCTLFELPTIPPSIPGLRVKEAFERGLRDSGVDLFAEHRVTRAQLSTTIELAFCRANGGDQMMLEAGAVILASGRFLGGGLKADRTAITETIFGLPVVQPADRRKWHRQNFLDPKGHAINRCGIEVDASFRPVDGAGRPVNPHLHAAGAILAHQDWMRMKCGVGLAAATAFGAVDAIASAAGRR